MSSPRKAYLYRLYPSDDQAQALQQQLDVARELYNACLLERREAHRLAGLTLNYYAQANQLKEIRQIRPDFASVNFKTLGLGMLVQQSGLGSSPQAVTWPAGASVA